MPIRPVDLLSLLPRSAESARVHGAQEGTAQSFQHALANEGKSRLELKGTQVQATPEGEASSLRTGADLQQHGSGGGPLAKRAKKGAPAKADQSPQEEGAHPPGIGSRLDLKL